MRRGKFLPAREPGCQGPAAPVAPPKSMCSFCVPGRPLGTEGAALSCDGVLVFMGALVHIDAAAAVQNAARSTHQGPRPGTQGQKPPLPLQPVLVSVHKTRTGCAQVAQVQAQCWAPGLGFGVSTKCEFVRRCRVSVPRGPCHRGGVSVSHPQMGERVHTLPEAGDFEGPQSSLSRRQKCLHGFVVPVSSPV